MRTIEKGSRRLTPVPWISAALLFLGVALPPAYSGDLAWSTPSCKLLYQGRDDASPSGDETFDIVIAAEGYPEPAMPLFDEEADRFCRAILNTPPFSEHPGVLRIWAAYSVSTDPGVDHPQDGRKGWMGSSLDGNGLVNSCFDFYYTKGGLGEANQSRRLKTTSPVPHLDAVNAKIPGGADLLVFSCNDIQYGGGAGDGWCAVYVGADDSIGVLLHMLGHCFKLADEFYVGRQAYIATGSDSPSPNLTIFQDHDLCKWAFWIGYEGRSGKPIDTHRGGHGDCETGVYRATDFDCVMNTASGLPIIRRGLEVYCHVCKQAVLRGIWKVPCPAAEAGRGSVR